MLLSGVAYGATGKVLGEDCRAPAKGDSSTQQQENNCAPVSTKAGRKQRRRAISNDLRAEQTEQAEQAEQAKEPVPETMEDEPARGAADNGTKIKGDVTKGSTTSVKKVTGKRVSAKRAADEDDNGVADDSGADGDVVVQGEVAESAEEDAAGSDDAQTLAANRGAIQGDSSAVIPQLSTELFYIDNVSPEPEDEVASSAGRDIFTLGIDAERTSDDYDARTYSFSYRNHRRSWFWPWQESPERGIDLGVNLDRTMGDLGPISFRSYHLQGSLGTYLGKGNYLDAQFGRHKLETDTGDSSISSHHLSAMFGLDHPLSLQLESSHDFIYSSGAVTGGISKQLTAYNNTAALRLRPTPRLRMQGIGTYSEYPQDGKDNIGRQADASALYGISTGTPWIWLGVGGSHISYTHIVPDYWSPHSYTAYGLRFESSFPLRSRLAASAALNLNRQIEDGTKGNGYYLKVGVRYRLHKELYANLDFSKSKSLQTSSHWSSDGLMFTISGPLF